MPSNQAKKKKIKITKGKSHSYKPNLHLNMTREVISCSARNEIFAHVDVTKQTSHQRMHTAHCTKQVMWIVNKRNKHFGSDLSESGCKVLE